MKKEKESKLLKRLKIAVIRMAVNILNRELIGRINFEPLALYLKSQTTILTEIIDKLTDKDPDNRTQLAEVWNKHKESFSKQSLEATKQSIVQLVKNPLLAADIVMLLEEATMNTDDPVV